MRRLSGVLAGVHRSWGEMRRRCFVAVVSAPAANGRDLAVTSYTAARLGPQGLVCRADAGRSPTPSERQTGLQTVPRTNRI
jgi:hypothetical protein